MTQQQQDTAYVFFIDANELPAGLLSLMNSFKITGAKSHPALTTALQNAFTSGAPEGVYAVENPQELQRSLWAFASSDPTNLTNQRIVITIDEKIFVVNTGTIYTCHMVRAQE